jgi:hypothetical protein
MAVLIRLLDVLRHDCIHRRNYLLCIVFTGCIGSRLRLLLIGCCATLRPITAEGDMAMIVWVGMPWRITEQQIDEVTQEFWVLADTHVPT